jgi:hypothetical protein
VSLPSKGRDNLEAFRLNERALLRGICLVIDTDNRLKAYCYPASKIKQHTEFLLEVSLHHDKLVAWLKSSAGRTSPAI